MIVVDAHVHIYDCYDLRLFFESAFANFECEAFRLGEKGNFTGILLLAERARENWFHRLLDRADNRRKYSGESIGKWTFHRTQESHSLLAQSSTGQGLIVIAGRQIVTAEDLEVLALMTNSEFEDGLTIDEVVRAVKDRSGLPVIPWGFGKWMGRRGMWVKKILNKSDLYPLFLGDNGGRPAFLPRPFHFRLAEEKGIFVLPGSDPLPIQSECGRVGSFGFVINGSIVPISPAKDLKQILLDKTTRPQPYGQLEHPWLFFRNQLAMQIIKLLHRTRSIT